MDQPSLVANLPRPKGEYQPPIRGEKEAPMRENYEFNAPIHELPDTGGAYVIFPWNLREEFGAGRVKVHALFDGIPYDGSIVNMGVKDEAGNIAYILGVRKDIRKTLGKGQGDMLHVVVTRRP